MKSMFAAILPFLTVIIGIDAQELTGRLISKKDVGKHIGGLNYDLPNDRLAVASGNCVIGYTKDLKEHHVIYRDPNKNAVISALCRDEKSMVWGIVIENNDVKIFDKDFKESRIKIPRLPQPATSIAFSARDWYYVMTTDREKPPRWYIGDDKRTENSAAGNLIGAVLPVPAIAAIIPWGGNKILAVREEDGIAAYPMSWNYPQPYKAKDDISEDPRPVINLAQKEILVTAKDITCATLNEKHGILYFVIRHAKSDSVYRYTFSDKRTVLLYEAKERQRVSAIATSNDFDVYLSAGDKLLHIADSAGTLTVKNDSGLGVSVYVNDTYATHLSSRETLQLNKIAGEYRITVQSYSGTVYLDNTAPVLLENRTTVTRTILRQFPLRLLPNNAMLTSPPAVWAMDENGITAYAVHNPDGRIAVNVIDVNSEPLYTLFFDRLWSEISLHMKNSRLIAYHHNMLETYDTKTGQKIMSITTDSPILSVASSDIGILTLQRTKIMGVNYAGTEFFTHNDNKRAFSFISWLLNGKIVLADDLNVEIWAKDEKNNFKLRDRVPISQAGQPKVVVEHIGGEYTILNVAQELRTFRHGKIIPDRIFRLEPGKFLYSYTEKNVPYMAFYREGHRRMIWMIDVELPQTTSNYWVLPNNTYSVLCANTQTVLLTEDNNTSITRYIGGSKSGSYHFFSDNSGVFISQQEGERPDTYRPLTDGFLPTRNLLIKRGNNISNFTENEIAQIFGGEKR